MKKILYFVAALLLLCGSCNQSNKDQTTIESKTPDSTQVDTIKCVGNIPLPLKHIKRDSVVSGSFGEYLRNLPLKPKNYPTHLYNGTEKVNQRAKFCVVDMDIDTVDLQQCADACIRLYAEYLWQSKQYDKIKFHFVNGFLADYNRWAHGERIQVNANHASWFHINSQEDYSYKTFREYLLMVFMYASTVSLPSDMEMNKWGEINIGDVVIQPGTPGHAVIVVDKAGEFFLLAQSYMPAQEIEILQGPHGCSDVWNTISMAELPNGRFDEYSWIHTPEWSFRLDNSKSKIMHFKN